MFADGQSEVGVKGYAEMKLVAETVFIVFHCR